MTVERKEIVSKCAEYVLHCLGCAPGEPLLIGYTIQEKEVADLFWDSRCIGADPGMVKQVEDWDSRHIGADPGMVQRVEENVPVPHYRMQSWDGSTIGVQYIFKRGQGNTGKLTVEGDQNIPEWEALAKHYDAKHAVGFIDRADGELPWRIAFIGLNQKMKMVYGHGPGTTMDHMKGHFMIDYEKAAALGTSLTEQLSAHDVIAYAVHSERGTKYVLLRNEKTVWHNDLMPRPFKDSKTGELVGDVGNVPGGEVYEEYSEIRHIEELGVEIPVMTRRPAFGVWVADLSVGSAKKSLKEGGSLVRMYAGVDPDSMMVMPSQAGVVTRWTCDDADINTAMEQELTEDPYVTKECIIVQEPLAFGFNEKADPLTDDLLEGEKAPALHVGFGGVLSHIDILASMEGTDVMVVKKRVGGPETLDPNDVQNLVNRDLDAIVKRFDWEKVVMDGRYRI